MERVTLYLAYTRQVAFEGTKDEAWSWLMDQAYHMKDGRVIYRTWEDDGEYYYDVGPVYFARCELR